jgi:hypothetical protein
MSTKVVLLIVSVLLVQPSMMRAEDFLGAPVVPGGEVVQKSDSRLEYETHLSHDEILSFYKEALRDLPDIKIRDWKDATYIEDDGRLAWHSVMISKGDQAETTVVIMKDNWTWIMGTLVLRYVGVFVVLLVLFLGISLSGSITSRFLSRTGAEK